MPAMTHHLCRDGAQRRLASTRPHRLLCLCRPAILPLLPLSRCSALLASLLLLLIASAIISCTLSGLSIEHGAAGSCGMSGATSPSRLWLVSSGAAAGGAAGRQLLA